MASAEAIRSEGVCARASAYAKLQQRLISDGMQSLPRAASEFVAEYTFLSAVVAPAPRLSWTCNHLGLRREEVWGTDLRYHKKPSSSLR